MLLVMLIVVETAVLHLLLVRFVPPLAYALSAASLGLLLWLIADYRAMGRGGVAVDETELRLHVGRRLRATIPRDAVTRAISPTWQDIGAASPRYLDPTKPSAPNVLVIFDDPQTVTLLNVVRRPITRLALHLDDPAAFLSALEQPAPR